MTRKSLILLFLVAVLWPVAATAQSVDPQAYYTNEKGEELVSRSISDGQAPLNVVFRSNPTDMDGYSPSYEWHFRRVEQGAAEEELFVRYEEDTEYTFVESGTYYIVQKTRLEQDGAELDSITITLTISDSMLEFPNAFSPNHDDWNDIYQAKEGWRNIVEFRAIIFNRWGQKLYEWTDPAGGWDGTHNGHDVKEGVYFVLVRAKGADGREYNIRKDVNLLRTSITEGGQTSGGE
jgi:gliding motility-associated-like protein